MVKIIEIAIEIGIERLGIAAIFDFDSDPDFDPDKDRPGTRKA